MGLQGRLVPSKAMPLLLNTIRQIWYCDSVHPAKGLWRHIGWQFRRMLRLFPCELTIAGSRLYVPRAGGVAALVNAMGEYDFNNMNFLKWGLRGDGGTFVDVGANIGTYTLIASELPEAKVVSIEPHPSTFESLKHNVQLNGRHNVRCLNAALSSENADLRFTDLSESALNSVVLSTGNGHKALLVKGRRFEGVCREFGLIPDFVKIDVEGHERLVLEGFGDFRASAKVIFVEGGDRPEVRSWMEVAGYSGPWYIHFNDKVFSRRMQGRPEDPAFVRSDFLSELLVKCFKFENDAGQKRYA